MPTPTGSTGFRVRPDELEAAGRTAEEIAARTPAETRSVLEASDRAVDALGRCEVADALHRCTEAWHQLLTDLSTSVHRRGQGLVETARAYRSTDADAAAGFGAGAGR